MSGLLLMAGNWLNARSRKATLETMSLDLGLSFEQLDKYSNAQKVLDYGAARFTPELLRNRISDLWGVLWGAFNWLTIFVEAGVFVGVIWTMIQDEPKNVVYLWTILPIALISALLSQLSSSICKLVTGRYPGQARAARKDLVKLAAEVRSRNAEAAELRGRSAAVAHTDGLDED
jgi:hypothetical protein